MADELGIAANARQQVVEVVGDAAGQPAHRFQLLRLPQLVLEPQPIADVEHGDQRRRLAHVLGRGEDGLHLDDAVVLAPAADGQVQRPQPRLAEIRQLIDHEAAILIDDDRERAFERQQLGHGVAEQRRAGGVHVGKAIVLEDEDRDQRVFDERPELQLVRALRRALGGAEAGRRLPQAHDHRSHRGLGQQVLSAHVHPADAAVLVPAVQPGEERDAGTREQVGDERLPALHIVRTGEAIRGVTVQLAGRVAEQLGDARDLTTRRGRPDPA